MKRFSISASVVLMAALALTGCASADYGNNSGGTESGSLAFYSVPLPAGGYVDCVASEFSGSVIYPDCDWANSANSSSTGDSGSLVSYMVSDENGGEVVCVASQYTSSAIAPDCNWPVESNR